MEIQNQWKSKNQSGIEIFNKSELIVYQGDDYFLNSFLSEGKKNYAIEAFINYYRLQNLKALKNYKSNQFELIVTDNSKILIIKDLKLKIPLNLRFDYIVINQKITPSEKAYFNDFTPNLITYQ